MRHARGMSYRQMSLHKTTVCCTALLAALLLGSAVSQAQPAAQVAKVAKAAKAAKVQTAQAKTAQIKATQVKAAQAKATQAKSATAQPNLWPALQSPIPEDPRMEARISALMAKMSLEQKVGQIIQGDLASLTPEDLYTYHLGSVFNGGNSDPGNKYNAPAADWLAAADAFYEASMRPNGTLPRIPMIWGTDAVHGHNNIVGATLFPHNIGLGAARNPALMRKIGQVTAKEVRVTGIDWTFAPTLSVVRDDRWGRTYEGFGEHPEIAVSYAGPLVEGLQGKIGAKDWLKGAHVIATAKHFVGDGGTKDGKDQGDAQVLEATLRDIFAAPYGPALQAGVQSVMASFSSWNGVKLHGNRSLLTRVVKERWNFSGFLVGDWNAHGQIPGCTNTDCTATIAAGLDMYMAPDSWKGLYHSTLRDVKSGKLSQVRLDDAVRRILRIKFRAGLFDGVGKPSTRAFAGNFALLGAPEHRGVARQAVRESLVLLKNNSQVLPLKPQARILVAGDGADNMTKQTGGWTLTWQGTNTKRADFPNAQTIWEGIEEAVKAGGGSASLSVNGDYTQKPDVAIVVFGEDPYAEFQGDRSDMAFDDPGNSLATLRKLQEAGIPTVSIFLSGRAMWVNPYLNASDAFVAAWLPGSEGGGIADVLFGKADFKGKLSYSWPKNSDQNTLNVGDKNYDPLFAYGFGLTYKSKQRLAMLDETRARGPAVENGVLFRAGKVTQGRRLLLGAPDALTTNPGPDLISARPADRNAQEDSLLLAWTGAGLARAAIQDLGSVDLSREANGALSLVLDIRVNTPPTQEVSLGMGCGPDCMGRVSIGEFLRDAAQKNDWVRLAVPLQCLADKGADMKKITQPLALTTNGALALTLSNAQIMSVESGTVACKA